MQNSLSWNAAAEKWPINELQVDTRAADTLSCLLQPNNPAVHQMCTKI